MRILCNYCWKIIDEKRKDEHNDECLYTEYMKRNYSDVIYELKKKFLTINIDNAKKNESRKKSK